MWLATHYTSDLLKKIYILNLAADSIPKPKQIENLKVNFFILYFNTWLFSPLRAIGKVNNKHKVQNLWKRDQEIMALLTLSNSDPISERGRKWTTSRDQSQHLSDSPSVSSLLEW